MLMAKTTTSTEVKQRWENKAYRKFLVRLRYDADADIIQFIEDNKNSIGTSQLFREALEMYMNANK